MNQSIYVVTGALGFIGFNLSTYLSFKGHRVIGLDKGNDKIGIRKWRKQNLISKGIKISDQAIIGALSFVDKNIKKKSKFIKKKFK